MSDVTFYRWVIDCPDNIPQEFIEYIMNNNELSDVEIDIDFITFETYGLDQTSTEILFNILEKILLDSAVHYYMEANELTTTGEYLYSASEYYEES